MSKKTNNSNLKANVNGRGHLDANSKKSRDAKRANDASRRAKKSNSNCSSEPDFRPSNATRMEDIHSNNIEWWNKSPIYPDATSIPQNRFPGYMYDDRKVFNPSGYEATPVVESRYETYPSIMVLDYVPTIGYSSGHDSPINRSFTSLYAQILAHTNSGNLGFTQASLAMITIAAYSVAMTIGHAKRILGLRRVWDNSNANLPEGILQPLGMTAPLSDIDWEDYRVRLNTLIDSFNALNIPKYVSIFDRAFQLGYNIYADEDSTEAQFYAFNSNGFYIYQDTENKAKYLTWSEFLSGYQDTYPDLKLADPLSMFINALDLQLRALRSTSDIALIMGSFRRAFPSSAAMRFDYVAADDVIVPYYDKVMLWQINNADIIPGTLANLDVSENVVGDYIVCEPQVIGINSGGDKPIFNSNAFHTGARYIHSYDGEWSPEFIMEATRLKVTLDPASNGLSGYIKNSGTEIITGAKVWSRNKESGYKYLWLPGDLYWVKIANHPTLGRDIKGFFADVRSLLNTASYPLTNDIPEALQNASKFRNRPLIYCYQGYPTDPQANVDKDFVNSALQRMYFMHVLGDMYKFATITPDQLAQLHLAALQSAYLVNVPTNWE